GRDRGIDRRCLGAGAFGGHRGEGVEYLVIAFDAGQCRRDDLAGAVLSRGDGGGDVGGGREAHALKTGAGSASSASGNSPTVRACPSETARCSRIASRHSGRTSMPSSRVPASIKAS